VGVGLEPGSIVKFKVCLNYEFVPRFSIMDLIGAQPSPEDLQEEELVINWTADLPKSGSVSIKEATKAPTISVVEDNGSGFGMFFDVIQELAPYALKALPMLL
jgi:hypothetical protein